MLTGTWADVVRFVVLALAILAAFATLAVLVLHYRVWRRAPSDAGLVPLHVWLIATAHLGFIVGSAVGVIERINEPLVWRAYLYAASSVLTLAALFIIARVQRRKVQVGRTTMTTVAVEESVLEPGPNGDAPTNV